MQYQKTWKNTVIKVFSIIEIIVAVLAIVTSLLFIAGGLAVSGAANLTPEQLAANGGLTAEEAAQTAATLQGGGGAISILGLLLLVGSILDLVAGILGVRGANDPSKLMPFIVITIIGLAITGITTIINAVNGSVAYGSLISIAISGLLLFLAFSVRSEYQDYLSKRKKTRR